MTDAYVILGALSELGFKRGSDGKVAELNICDDRKNKIIQLIPEIKQCDQKSMCNLYEKVLTEIKNYDSSSEDEIVETAANRYILYCEQRNTLVNRVASGVSSLMASLMTSLMTKPSSRLAPSPASRYANAGAPWTPDEDTQLINELGISMNVYEISVRHGRSPTAINFRISLLQQHK